MVASGSGHFTPGDDFMNGSGSSNRARNRLPSRYQTAAPYPVTTVFRFINPQIRER